jgi:hypothetical protein
MYLKSRRQGVWIRLLWLRIWFTDEILQRWWTSEFHKRQIISGEAKLLLASQGRLFSPPSFTSVGMRFLILNVHQSKHMLIPK